MKNILKMFYTIIEKIRLPQTKHTKGLFLIALAKKILILLLFYFYGCSCNCGNEDYIKIPESILKKADNFIISNVGKEFFDKNIKIDLIKSKLVDSYFELHYKMQIENKTYVDEDIHFYVDSLGNIAADRDIIGIPDCKLNPSYCNFNIDEMQAKIIAEKKGLEPGIKEWKIGFLWNEKWQRYLWHILNVLYEAEGSNGYIGNGKEVIIDPSNGEVLEFNEWKIR